jgi:hypothetical protein
MAKSTRRRKRTPYDPMKRHRRPGVQRKRTPYDPMKRHRRPITVAPDPMAQVLNWGINRGLDWAMVHSGQAIVGAILGGTLAYGIAAGPERHRRSTR